MRLSVFIDGGPTMSTTSLPYLANDAGAEKVFVGSKEIKCMGARSPFDHPHVYLDMGGDSQILCPYCSTLFVHDPKLRTNESDPPDAIAGVEQAERV